MPYRAPGPEDPRIKWILAEVQKSQQTLDASIAEAEALPDSDLSKPQRLRRYRALKSEVDSSFYGLDNHVATWAERDISSLYTTGWFTGATQLPGAGFDFTLPHREALDVLSYDAYDDVATRLQSVRQGFTDTVDLQELYEGLSPEEIVAIQAKSRSSVAQALLTGNADPKKVARSLSQDLWKDNPSLKIIDAGGKQWEMQTYTRMLVRTKSAHAYNSGSLNKYAEEGVDRVEVFDGTEDDRECADANGQTWSLWRAMRNTSAHPNCRRAFAPKQNKGLLDVPDEEDTNGIAYRLVQAESAFNAVDFLRDFYRTGQVNVGSTLARRVLTPYIPDFVPNTVVEGLVNKLASDSIPHIDALIESIIDPVLYDLGLIRNIPDRAVMLAASRDPASTLGMVSKWLDDAVETAFDGAPPSQQVQDLLDLVDENAARVRASLRFINVVLDPTSTVPKEVSEALRLAQFAAADLGQQEIAGVAGRAKSILDSGVRFADTVSRASAEGLSRENLPLVLADLRRATQELDSGVKLLNKYAEEAGTTLIDTFGINAEKTTDLLEAISLTARRVETGTTMLNRYATAASEGFTASRSLRLLNATRKFTESLAIEGGQAYTPERAKYLLSSLRKSANELAYGLRVVEDGATRVAGAYKWATWANETVLQQHAYGRFAGDTMLKILRKQASKVDFIELAKNMKKWSDEGLTIRYAAEIVKEDVKAEASRAFEFSKGVTEIITEVLERETPIDLTRFVRRKDFDGKTLQLLQEFGVTDANMLDEFGNEIPIRRLVDRVLEVEREAERAILAVDDQLADADNVIRFPIERVRRALDFPESVGESLPAPRYSMAADEALEEFTDDLAESLSGDIETIPINTAALDDFKTFFMMIERDVDTAEVAEVRRAIRRYVRSQTGLPPGVPGSMDATPELLVFWEDVLGASHPAIVKYADNAASDPEDVVDIVLAIVSRVDIRGGGKATSIRLSGRNSVFFNDVPEYATRLAETLDFIDADFFFEYSDEITDAIEASPVVFNKRILVQQRSNGAAIRPLSDEALRQIKVRDFFSKLYADTASELRRFELDDAGLSLSRMESWAANKYGPANVSRLDGGAHGLLWRVVDEQGKVFVIKPNNSSKHVGDVLSGPFAASLNSVVARILGSDVTPYRVVTINGQGDSVFVSPFVKGAREMSSVLNQASDQPSLRRLHLFHILTGEGDTNVRNFMIDDLTGQVTRIDHEMSFSLNWEQTILDGQVRVGTTGISSLPSSQIRRILRENLTNGSDATFLTERPTVLYTLTEAERNSDVGTRVFNKHITASILGPVSDEGLILGRYAPIEDDFWGVSWDPVVSLSDTELKFVTDYLADPEGVWDEIWDEALEGLRHYDYDAVDSTKWDGGVDGIEEAAREFFDRRLRQAVDTGLIDISGGVTDTVSSTGTPYGIGDVVDVVLVGDDPLGIKEQRLSGIVANIWEDTLGRKRARVVKGIGVGLSESELRVEGRVDIVTILLDDYAGAEQRVGRTLADQVDDYRRVVDEVPVWKVEDVDLNPNSVSRRVTDKYGMTLGFEDGTIPIEFPMDEYWFIDESGGPTQMGTQTLFSLVGREVLESELSKLPSRYRPSRIVFHTGFIDVGDGPRLGMFDEVSGVLHISTQTMLRSLETKTIQGYVPYGIREQINGYAVKGIGSRGIDEALDTEGLRRVFRHELGHSAHVALEDARRASIRTEVVEQILRDSDGAITEDELVGFATTLLGDVEIPEGQNALQYLIDLRVDAVADVINTNLVVETQEIIKGADNIPSWAVASFGAARRGEPTGHHEVFADIWSRVAAKGGGNKAVKEVAEELNMKPSALRKYLAPEVPDAPSSWDADGVAVWLQQVLDPRATRIVPERNTNARLLWDQGDYIDELEFRTFDLAGDEGGGGFTYDIQLGKLVEPEGYSVAIAANEHKVIGATEEEVRKRARKEIEEYVKEHFELLRDSEYKLGGWFQENDDGTWELVLDTSKIFDDPVDAAQFGFAQGQDAAYDLNIFDDVPLRNQFETFDEWLDSWYKGKVPYEEYVIRRERIPSLVANTAKVNGPRLTNPAAGPVKKAPVTMRIFPEKVVEDLRSKLYNRYTVEITDKKMYDNFVSVLEEARRRKITPDELKERYDFYVPWHDRFVEAAQLYDENPARLMAAAALFSPKRNADNNYVVVRLVADYIWADKKFTAREVSEIRDVMTARHHQYLGYGKTEDAEMFKAVADSINVGSRPSDFGTEVLGFVLDPIIKHKMSGYTNYNGLPYEGTTLGVIHGGSAYANTGYRAIQVLRGELSIDDIMRGAKVRPFFNNILDPLDVYGNRDITIDFHMMNMALRVVGSEAQGVQVDSTGKIFGMDIGMKGFVADVLRDVFDDGWGEALELESDAQLQEILWGLWRTGLDEGWWGDLERIRKK